MTLYLSVSFILNQMKVKGRKFNFIIIYNPMSSDFVMHSRKASFYKQFTSLAEFTPSFGLHAATVCSLHKMKMFGLFICLIKRMR